MSGVWVVAEQRRGEILQVTLDLLAKGQELAKDLGEILCALLLGHEVEGPATILIEYGAEKVVCIHNERLAGYVPEAHTYTLQQLIEWHDPSVLLFGATWNGRELAARVAARVGTALATECTELSIRDGRLLVGRSVYAGRLHALCLMPGTGPQMATVQPEALEPAQADPSRTGTIESFGLEISPDLIRTQCLDAVEGDPASMALEEAAVIIGAGRGIGCERNLEPLKELAELLRAPIGGTRYARYVGWIPPDRVIGQTGKTVSARLYIACGISGAIQHAVGIRNVRRIVAINTDASAPIFKIADVKIVGDVGTMVSAISSRLRETIGESLSIET